MSPRHQNGFAIVSAIFILVVLAALGAFMVSVSTNQQIGSALDVQGARAYQAARAGLEWGLYRQMRASSCAGSSSFVPPAAGLSDFTVTVKCEQKPDTSSNGPTVYIITSTACNQPGASADPCPNTTNPGGLYVERKMSVSF